MISWLPIFPWQGQLPLSVALRYNIDRRDMRRLVPLLRHLGPQYSVNTVKGHSRAEPAAADIAILSSEKLVLVLLVIGKKGKTTCSI